MGEVAGLDLRGGDAVDGEDAGGDDREEFGWGSDGGRVLEEGADAGDFGVGDVDEKEVGEVGGGGELKLVDDGMLHEEDEHDLHDAEAEGGEERGGWIAGAVKVGEAVAKSGGQMQAGAGKEGTKRGEDEEGGEEEDEERADQAEREPLADLGGI